MSLFIILSSKTDQYRDGTWILIARNSTIIFRFWNWSDISYGQILPTIQIFKIISHLSATKTGYKVSKEEEKKNVI